MRVILTAIIGICMLAGSASALSERGQCLLNARDARKAGYKAVWEEFKNARVGCDGPCFGLCRSNYIGCRTPVLAAQQSCLEQAEASFRIAHEACKQQFGCRTNYECARNALFQQCLNPSRVVRITAVRSCNRTANTTLKSCDTELKACNKACRQPDQPSSGN